MDKGFFASVPRIVRTGYVQLSATTKWIYVCLKDLCGENGTCYRTLRTLAEEVGGVSISTLSEGIRALRQAGLIDASKKRRPDQPTAKETWHISIINIWEQNGTKHPVKRSLSEQNNVEHETECSTGEHSNGHAPDPVLSANKNVRSANGNASFCSVGEQKRSLISTKEDKSKHDHFEEISDEEENESSTSSQAPDSINQSDINLNLHEDERDPPKALVSHPEHKFIWFDDLLAPTKMIVELTHAFPHPLYCEQEDKRRERLAMWEVKPFLESRGLQITVEWKHEDAIPQASVNKNALTFTQTSENEPPNNDVSISIDQTVMPNETLKERIAMLSAKEKKLIEGAIKEHLDAVIIAMEWKAILPKSDYAGNITELLLGHAMTLAGKKLQSGELEGCRQWLIDNDQTGKFARGVWLGNIVGKLDDYRVYAKDQARYEESQRPRPMTEEERDAFSWQIQQNDSDLVLYHSDDGDGKYCILLAISDDAKDDVCVWTRKDWNELGRATIRKARPYGREYWATQARKQFAVVKEEVAV